MKKKIEPLIGWMMMLQDTLRSRSDRVPMHNMMQDHDDVHNMKNCTYFPFFPIFPYFPDFSQTAISMLSPIQSDMIG